MASKKGLHISKSELYRQLELFARNTDDAFSSETIVTTELNPQTHQNRLTFTVGAHSITMDLYFRTDKTITIVPMGDDVSKNFGKQFKELIANDLEAPIQGNFTCKIDKGIFDKLKEYLCNKEGVNASPEENKGPNGLITRFNSDIGDNMTLTYYETTKTLRYQGMIMNLHMEVKTFLTSFVNEYIPTELSKSRFAHIDDEVDLLVKTHLCTSFASLDKLLQDHLQDALKHVALRISFNDYSSWAYPALKALEGRIRQIFDFEGVSLPCKTNFVIDDSVGNKEPLFEMRNGKYYLKGIVGITNGKAESNLNDCYDFFVKNRHELFHTLQALQFSRRLETPESADSIVFEVCRLIEKSYVELGK